MNKNDDERTQTLHTIVDPDTDGNTQLELARMQLIYSSCGLVLGLVCVLGGIYLFIEGVTGELDWTASILGQESELLNAAPGAVLFVIGLFIIIVTRYKFQHVKSK